MNREIKYGDYKYTYCLVEQNRKTLSLTVCPDLSIVLKAPIGTHKKKIESFFKRKWSWLEEQLNFFRQFQVSKMQKEYVSGESFLYLGRQYKLVVKRGREDCVSLQQGRLYLYTTDKVRNGNKNKKIIEKWYQQRAQYIFHERYTIVRKKFCYEDFPQVSTRKMNRRWGSYLKSNKILLNPLLIHTSKKCIDYVLVHELCHVQYNNHGKKFYSLLKRKCSDWEQIKEELELRFK